MDAQEQLKGYLAELENIKKREVEEWNIRLHQFRIRDIYVKKRNALISSLLGLILSFIFIMFLYRHLNLSANYLVLWIFNSILVSVGICRIIETLIWCFFNE
jgi:hypothetical protein